MSSKGECPALAYLFHLVGCDIVACDVSDVPGVPNEAADERHGSIVIQRNANVKKDGEGNRSDLLISPPELP